jgi:hypothetical protein
MRTNKAKEAARAKSIREIESKFGDNVHGAKAPRTWATEVYDALDMDATDDDDVREYIESRGWWCDDDETED